MIDEEVVQDVLDKIRICEKRLKNAEEGLKNLDSEIPACIIVSLIAVILGQLFPVLFAIAAIAMGNASGKIFFFRKSFKRAIKREKEAIRQYQAALKSVGLLSES